MALFIISELENLNSASKAKNGFSA